MPRKSKLPPGVYSRNGILYLRYWDKLDKKSKSIKTGIIDQVANYKVAREWKENYLHEVDRRAANLLLDMHRSSAGCPYLTTAASEYVVVKNLSGRSKESLDYSVNHWIAACGNKLLLDYTKKDYHNFIIYMAGKNLSQQSQGLISRTLYALFNYYLKQKIIDENIITVIKPQNKKPEAIPPEDLKLILSHLRERNLAAYNFAKFLYLSGFRIGEAIRLRWVDIDYKKKLLYVHNHKAKRVDVLPLLPDLEQHLESISPDPGSDRVFPQYTSTDGLKFFIRVQEEIWGKGKHRYSLHQLRKTFVTKLISEGVHMFHVKTLARHSDIRTTLLFYAEENINNLRKELEGKISFGGSDL